MGFYYQGYQPRFGPMIALSASVHILILSLTILSSWWVSPRPFIIPVYTVELVGPIYEKPRPESITIREKPKGIEATKPKPLLKEKKVVLPAKGIKKAIPLKKEEKVSIEKTLAEIEEKLKDEREEEIVRDSVKEIEDKMLASAVKGIREKVRDKTKISKTIKVDPPPSHEPSSPVNVISTTGNVTGELTEAECRDYFEGKIQDSWTYPGPAPDLRTMVTIRIDRRDGRLLERRIERPSGNGVYDQYVIRAIEKAAPFWPLPEGCQAEVITMDIHPEGSWIQR